MKSAYYYTYLIPKHLHVKIDRQEEAGSSAAYYKYLRDKQNKRHFRPKGLFRHFLPYSRALKVWTTNISVSRFFCFAFKPGNIPSCTTLYNFPPNTRVKFLFFASLEIRYTIQYVFEEKGKQTVKYSVFFAQ